MGDLEVIATEALSIGDVVSAVIFVAPTGGRPLELAAAAGIEGPPLTALVAAVRNPAHPIARTLADDRPSFDVRPMAPGGPKLRSHLPLLLDRAGEQVAVGVMAVAHDAPLGESERERLIALAARAAGRLGS